MVITQDDLTWMFKDPEWKNKFLIGSLLALIAFFIPLLGLLALIPMYGYTLILMRATMRGEPHVLPKWAEFGELLVSGLKASLSSIGYFIPGCLVFACGIITFFSLFFGSAFGASVSANGSRAAASSALGLFAGQFILFFTFGIGFVIFALGAIIVPVAIGQYVRTGEISAGYRWSEISRILRANPAGFVLAWLVYLGLTLILSFTAQILYYTIVLCVFIPFLAAPMSFYLALLFAQFFGAAYREAASRAGLLNPSTPQLSAG